jgi:arylsulfatase A-like enzyme
MGLSLLTCGCGPAGPPDVILISVDTLRPDHLGIYGYHRDTSPFLDEFFADGVRFDNAIAPTSWTLPSHMSLMTSLYPHRHRVESDDVTLPPDVVTLAALLWGAGYATTAFVSAVYVSRSYGFARGFERFEELLQRGGKTVPADAFVDRVVAWAEDPEQPVVRPFFLFLHLFDPHMDYAPPLEHAHAFAPELRDSAPGAYRALAPYIRGLSPDALRIAPDLKEQVVALYDGEIRFLDAELRRLFERLDARGLLENALVVFTSDHGEEFDEHGSMEGHGWTLYGEVTRVPLLLRFPAHFADGRYAGTTTSALVQTLDVAPTILAVADVPAAEAFEGLNLLPAIRGAVDRRLAFSQLRRFNQKWAVQDERFKLVYTADTGTNTFGVPLTGGFELYDLAVDPAEHENLYDPEAPEARRLTAALHKWMRERDPGVAPRRETLTPQQRRQLRALGYLRNDASDTPKR